MRKVSLNKLHKAKVKVWQERWEQFLDSVLELMPDSAVTIFLDEQDRIFAQYVDLTPEADKALDKQMNAYGESCIKKLNLAPKEWEDWFEYAASEQEMPDFDKPNLILTPQALKQPPFNPITTFSALKQWTYPPDWQGIVEAQIAMSLSLAVKVSTYAKSSP